MSRIRTAQCRGAGAPAAGGGDSDRGARARASATAWTRAWALALRCCLLFLLAAALLVGGGSALAADEPAAPAAPAAAMAPATTSAWKVRVSSFAKDEPASTGVELAALDPDRPNSGDFTVVSAAGHAAAGQWLALDKVVAANTRRLLLRVRTTTAGSVTAGGATAFARLDVVVELGRAAAAGAEPKVAASCSASSGFEPLIAFDLDRPQPQLLTVPAYFARIRQEELALAHARPAKEFFASPQGKAQAAGSKDDPLDLLAALRGQPALPPGATLWLAGGVYSLPAGPADKARVLITTLAGAPGAPIIVRPLPGAQVLFDGALDISGGHLWLWGLEITDRLRPDFSGDWPPSVTARAPGIKLINLHLHGQGQGVGFWSPAPDSEIYGCIIHDFGWGKATPGGDRGHGHAIYTQNAVGFKRLTDNVMFNGFGWNIHAYTQGGELNRYFVSGNVSFAAGARKEGQVTDTYLFSGYVPVHQLWLLGNYSYNASASGPGVRLHSYKNALNTGLVVRDNVFVGSAAAMLLTRWESGTITGNRFWGGRVLAMHQPEPDAPADAWFWDQNTYLDNGSAQAFVGPKGPLTFANWQALGLDRHGQLLPGQQGRPSGVNVYVLPNAFEPGRGHVAVFNFDNQETVAVDLGGILKSGQPFQVRHLQQLAAPPIARGAWTGKPIALPTLRSKIAPQFEAYLVEPLPASE